MFRRALPLVLASMALPAMAQQSLSNEEIALAIKAGEDRRYDHMTSDCVATSGFSEGMFDTGISPTGSYSVIVAGAAGSIASKAAAAKRRYQSLTLAEVTPEMTAAVLYLTAVPLAPVRSGNKIRVASPVEAIVLKQKDGPVAIQPLTLTMEPVEWKNLMGGSIEGTSAQATFALADFTGLPAGDVDIVLITAAGERRCKIGQSDRAVLTQPGVPQRR